MVWKHRPRTLRQNGKDKPDSRGTKKPRIFYTGVKCVVRTTGKVTRTHSHEKDIKDCTDLQRRKGRI